MINVFEKPYKFCPTCKTKLIRKLIDRRKLLFCPNCNFVFWNNPKPVVSVILCHNQEILMLQRSKEPLKGYWCLPGGFIDYEETPEQAIAREAKEEVGTNISLQSLIGVYRIDNDPRGVHIDIIFEAKMKGEIKLSEEHKAYKFFPIRKLPKQIAYKHKEAIEDWLRRSIN